VVQSQRDQDGAWTSVVPNQPHEISNIKFVNSQGRDVIRGIQPKFVYHFTSPYYYEPVED
jgi:hypothetical protein